MKEGNIAELPAPIRRISRRELEIRVDEVKQFLEESGFAVYFTSTAHGRFGAEDISYERMFIAPTEELVSKVGFNPTVWNLEAISRGMLAAIGRSSPSQESAKKGDISSSFYKYNKGLGGLEAIEYHVVAREREGQRPLGIVLLRAETEARRAFNHENELGNVRQNYRPVS